MMPTRPITFFIKDNVVNLRDFCSKAQHLFAAFTLLVLFPALVNAAPPVVDSKPVIKVAVGQSYSYKLIASDDDGDVMTWSLPTVTGANPSWLSIDTNMVSETIAGSPGVSGDADGEGSDARFRQPYGFDIDDEGALIIADWQNDAIKKLEKVSTLNADGTITEAWVTTTIHKYTDSRTAPKDVVIGPDGNYYIAEYGRDTIDVLDKDTLTLTTYAGIAGTDGFVNGDKIGQATFDNPNSLDFDSDGNLYVADRGSHCIRKIDASTEQVSTLAGSCGTSGTQGGSGSSARFHQPVGLSVDSNDLIYVAQRASGSGGSSSSPSGTRGAVLSVTTAGFVTVVAGGPSDSSSQLMHPYDIYIDGFDNIYVAGWDSNRIHKIEPDGTESILVGTSSEGTTDSPGTIRFNDPIGIAVDREGFVYVSDHNNHTFRRLEFGARLVGTAPSTPGKHLVVLNVTDGGPATKQGFVLEVYDPNRKPVFDNTNTQIFSADTRSIVYSTSGIITSSKAADMDLDGDIDIVSSAQDSGNVVVSFNLGGGTFNDTNLPFDGGYIVDRSGSSPSTGAIANVKDLALADMNDDGYPDIVAVTGDSGEGVLVQYINNQDGTFTRTNITSTDIDDAKSLTVGYFDTNNTLDIVVASDDDNYIRLYRQVINRTSGNRTYSATTIANSFDGKVVKVKSLDFDADGDKDLVFSTNATTAENDLYLLLNNGATNPTFSQSVISDAGKQISDFKIADIDADGDNDIVVVSTESPTLYLVKQSRTSGVRSFDETVITTSTPAQENVALGDINADGKIDILTSSLGENVVYEYVGNTAAGSGFEKSINLNSLGQTELSLAFANSTELADIDLDGRLDLLANSMAFSPGPTTNLQLIRAIAPTTQLNASENTTSAITNSAIDLDSTDSSPVNLTYSITGGADALLFSIAPSTGALSFVTSPNFEVPSDDNADNTYELTLKVAETSNSASFTETDFSIRVENVNELPVITVASSVTTPNTQSKNIPFTYTDEDTDTVTAHVDTTPSNGSVSIAGATITYTPNALYQGSDSFVIQFRDGNGGNVNKTIAVTVTQPNRVPVVTLASTQSTSEDTPNTIAYSATDADSDTVTASVSTAATNGAVTIAGQNITYTPNTNFNGSDSYVVTFSDGNGGQVTKSVAVTVAAVNDDPIITLASTLTTNEDTLGSLAYSSTDAEGDAVLATVDTAPSNGVLAIAGANLNYTPGANYNGSDSFRVKFDDGNGGVVYKTVSVTVTPENDAPTITLASTQLLDEDTVSQIPLQTSDEDNDDLTVTVSTQASNGTVVATNTSVTYTPTANFNGTDSYTTTVSDGNGGTIARTVAVTVSPVNDDPTVTVNTMLVANGAMPLRTSFTFEDVDGDNVVAAISTQASSGSVGIANNSISYTANGGLLAPIHLPSNLKMVTVARW